MAFVVTFDLEGLLEKLTGQKWHEVSGLGTRCGLDYWYRTRRGSEAWINIDQDAILVQVDGETIYQGELADSQVKPFVSTYR